MRATVLSLFGLLAVLSLSAPALSQEEPTEWMRDVDAVAPSQDTGTTLILDELTRQPIPGARITWYAEVEGLRAPALGTALANVHGLATLDWTELATWDADGHFLVTAEGYAAKHEWGRFPPTTIEMVRGRDVTARVVDLLGRPVADADVEVFLGCGHGPILDFVQTDADGRVTVRGQDVDETQLWIEAPGSQADYLPLRDADGLGAGERVLLMAPGGIAEGVILDSAGRPLEGVEVRSFQCHRGPVGMTDRRGRFRLVGVADEASLYVSHRFAIEGWAIIEGEQWRTGIPLRVRLTPWGFAVETQERIEVVVRALGPDGRSVPDPDVVLVRDSDGWVHEPEFDDSIPPDRLRFVLPPGLYVPRAAYAFAEFEPDVVPIEVRPGAPMRVTLHASRRARLVVTGEIPEDAVTTVAIEGAVGSSLDEFLGDDGTEFVPLEGPVVVSVSWLGRSWFFPAARGEGGERVVHVDIPEPQLLRIPDDLHGDFELKCDGVPCDIEPTDGGFVTFASGALVLRVDTGEALMHIPVELSGEPGTEVAIRVPAEQSKHTVRVIPPPGLRAWMHVSITLLDGCGYSMQRMVDGPIEKPIDGPAWVRVERDDHVVWKTRVEGPGDVPFAWGDASLTFQVLDDGEDHVQVAVIVDGTLVPQRDPDDFSVVRVLGLEPGPHTVLLLPYDDSFLAKELRVVLKPGETRRRRVELTLR